MSWSNVTDPPPQSSSARGEEACVCSSARGRKLAYALPQEGRKLARMQRLRRTESGGDGAYIVARLNIQQQVASFFGALPRQHPLRIAQEFLFDGG